MYSTAHLYRECLQEYVYYFVVNNFKFGTTLETNVKFPEHNNFIPSNLNNGDC